MDNTVGSRGFVSLTARQEDILVGKLLGDGCLEQNGRFVRLRIDHGAIQEKYVLWLYEEFQSMANKPYKISVVDKRNSHVYDHWRFTTNSLPVLDKWRKLFYLGGKKIVPKNIHTLLTPLSLAIWYMDDGFRRSDCRGLYLCTSAYTQGEQYLLQDALRRRFSIQTALHYARKNVRIYIPSSQVDKFCNIVQSYMLSIFQYKLFDPVTTDVRHMSD